MNKMLTTGVQVVVVVLFLFFGQATSSVWLSLPSANAGCGSWTSEKFHWDDEDTNNANDWSGTLPKGTYQKATKLIASNIEQYFCTGSVDEVPLGSYCFYQNNQNCNLSFFLSFF